MKFSLRANHVILLSLMLGLSGCLLLPRPIDPNDPTTSVVFGYIETKGMPSEFDSARIEGSETKDYVTASAKRGAYWHIAVKPGFRQVRSFSGFTSRNMFGQGDSANIYRFDENDKNTIAITIKKPGVHFMGSYAFSADGDTFETRRIAAPSEKEVLQMVLKGVEEARSHEIYTRQYKMIKDRIAELR